MKKEFICLKDVCKKYENLMESHQVLDHFQLSVGEGEMIAIVGKSGKGKTTLLNILGFVDRIDEGQYFFEKEDVGKKTEKELAEMRNGKIGYVFQDFKLIDRMSAGENIAVPLYLYGEKESTIKHRVEKMAEQLGIEYLLERKVKDISGGEKQRVAIARALIRNPHLLLADEPTGALDLDTRNEILKIFHQIHDLGKTIIIVTHDMSVAQSCDRVIEL